MNQHVQTACTATAEDATAETSPYVIAGAQVCQKHSVRVGAGQNCPAGMAFTTVSTCGSVCADLARISDEKQDHTTECGCCYCATSAAECASLSSGSSAVIDKCPDPRVKLWNSQSEQAERTLRYEQVTQCAKLAKENQILPQKDWGMAGPDVQQQWGELSCEPWKICLSWKETYGIIPMSSWGTLPDTLWDSWDRSNCNQLWKVGKGEVTTLAAFVTTLAIVSVWHEVMHTRLHARAAHTRQRRAQRPAHVSNDGVVAVPTHCAQLWQHQLQWWALGAHSV